MTKSEATARLRAKCVEQGDKPITMRANQLLDFLDEIAGLEAMCAEWAGSASYGSGAAMMTPQRLIADTQELMTQRDAAMARAARFEVALTSSVECLEARAKQFRFYADQHIAKTPPDIGKAATNDAEAALCEVEAESVRAALEGKP